MAADRTSEHRLTPAEPGSGLDPDEVGRKTFETTFRGFDPQEVQAYLLTVASELRGVRERVFDLELRLAEAERTAEQAAAIDDERLTAALGDEVASILEAARTAAAKLRSQAELDAAARVRAGEEQAERLRREAEQQLEVRTAEARQAAAAIEQEAEALRVQAQIDAAAEVEAGKQSGREMVAEAQVVRERILKDLARRRRQARQQIEQLRAGRERLLEAYRVVRETMERATEELEISLPAAKAAAETAGRSIPDDDDVSVEQLESMLDAARDAGLIDARAAAVEAEIEAEIEADVEAAPRQDGAEAGAAGADEPGAAAVGDAAGDEVAEGEAAGEDTADTAEAPEAAEGTDGSEPAEAAEPAWTGRSTRRGRRAERIVADERAEPPLEGRRSSSVRVFRRDDGASVDEADQVDQAHPVAPAGEVARPDDVADQEEVDVVVEIVEEIVEVEVDDDGDEAVDGDEVVVIEEVVEVVDDEGAPEAEPETAPALAAVPDPEPEGGSPDESGAPREAEAATVVDPPSPTGDASGGAAESGAEGEAEGEVITGLFARIKADHADATADPPRRGRKGRAKRKANGNGNGHHGNGNGASDGAADAPAAAPAAAAPEAEPAPEPAAATLEGAGSDPDDAEPPQVRRDRALAGPSRGLGRALKRVVADEQNEVLDRVRREKKVPALDDVLPEESEHALRYAAAARGELADAAYAGATSADPSTAERPDVDDLAAEVSLAVVSQLRARFEAALAASPDDRDALLDALRAAYRDTKNERVDECVRHFAGEAFNRGVRAASASGLDVRMLVDAGNKPSLR